MFEIGQVCRIRFDDGGPDKLVVVREINPDQERPGLKCEQCGGSGEIFFAAVPDVERCANCGGTGTISDGTIAPIRLIAGNIRAEYVDNPGILMDFDPEELEAVA